MDGRAAGDGRMVKALPGELDVALAVHGGSRVHTFTTFTKNAATLRDRAAGVSCQAGLTRLLPILSSSLKHQAVRVVVYIGDVFEESLTQGRRIADAMGAQGTKLIVLHDTADPASRRDAEVFWDLAKRTGGCVLPFNAEPPGGCATFCRLLPSMLSAARSCCGSGGTNYPARWRCSNIWTSGAELEKRRVPCVRRFAARSRGSTLGSRHWRICGILVPSSTWSRPAPGLLFPPC